MVMLLASQLCCAVFLARLCFTQAEGNSFRLSSHDNKTLSHDSGFSVGNNTRCSWNCTVVDSDFPEHWKAVSIKHRLIEVVVEYEKKVTEQCVKQASRNSSANATEYFNVWLPAKNNPSNFDHGMQSLRDLFFSSNTNERVKIKAACAFRPLRTSAAEPAISTLNSDFLSQSVGSHLADHGLNVKRSNDCKAEEMSNSSRTLQPCITIGSTVNSTNSQFIRSVWFDRGSMLVAIFMAAFVYYSPAYICLFSPTVITENGLRQIVLEGASPVSFRSLLGNYFHSGCDTRHSAKMLFLRLVLLPLPFLPPAIFFDHLIQPVEQLSCLRFYKPLVLVSFVFYVFQAIYSSFFKVSPKELKSCVVFVNLTYNVDPRRQILKYLRMQPLIFIKCWCFFRKCFLYYFKMSRVVLPARWNMSPRRVFYLAGFLVFLSTIPAVTIILFAAMLVVDVTGLILTAPLCVLIYDDIICVITILYGGSLSKHLPVLVFVQILVRLLSTLGTGLLLFCAACGIAIIIAAVFILLLSEQSLPFVILFVLVCYYLWSSYSSFTNKYHDLSLILFKCYQEHRYDRQISNEPATAATVDPAQDAKRTPTDPENEGSVIKIPKELFDTACEKLMPIRESVCVLVLKVVFILSFVFLVFAAVMTFHLGATPMMRALVTFLTGSLPRIVSIYIDGARKRKLETMVIEERAPGIVQRYVKGSSSIDQENDSLGTNTEEVILVNGNEEAI